MDFSFEAGRVRLRNLRPADLPDFAAYRADPNVARFQGFDPYTEAEAARFHCRAGRGGGAGRAGQLGAAGHCPRR